jgi:hypothetical protein
MVQHSLLGVSASVNPPCRRHPQALDRQHGCRDSVPVSLDPAVESPGGLPWGVGQYPWWCAACWFPSRPVPGGCRPSCVHNGRGRWPPPGRSGGTLVVVVVLLCINSCSDSGCSLLRLAARAVAGGASSTRQLPCLLPQQLLWTSLLCIGVVFPHQLLCGADGCALLAVLLAWVLDRSPHGQAWPMVFNTAAVLCSSSVACLVCVDVPQHNHVCWSAVAHVL